jgi:hypothetical protein
MLNDVGRDDPPYAYFDSLGIHERRAEFRTGSPADSTDESDIDSLLPSRQTVADHDWWWREPWLPHAAMVSSGDLLGRQSGPPIGTV